MLKLLFIEDDKEAIEPVLKLIKKRIPDAEWQVSGFEEAEGKIKSLSPDVVILDLLARGLSAESEPLGLRTRDFIWNRRFCPIIIYSAEPGQHDEKHETHPFVKSIQKGRGSDQMVLDAVTELRPHVETLREAEEHIKDSFSRAMRDVAPYAFDTFEALDERMEVVKRSGRRRVAALMDEFSASGGTLAGWEQYLYPPVNKDIQAGDIIRKARGNHDDPEGFRLVLTPSCDLASSGGRRPKVRNVLVAKCCSIRTGLKHLPLQGKPSSRKFRERLTTSVLTPGYSGNIIPVPCLKNKIPTMAADLRNLELIPMKNINDNHDSDESFVRIASVDSPFRELITWAYLQISCRPGVPERDFDSWTDEIVENMQGEDGGPPK